jgi:hypothetical protein
VGHRLHDADVHAESVFYELLAVPGHGGRTDLNMGDTSRTLPLRSFSPRDGVSRVRQVSGKDESRLRSGRLPLRRGAASIPMKALFRGRGGPFYVPFRVRFGKLSYILFSCKKRPAAAYSPAGDRERTLR